MFQRHPRPEKASPTNAERRTTHVEPRSLSGIDSVGWFGLAQQLLRWQNGRVALLSAHFAALDLPHDPFAILGHLFPTGSYAIPPMVYPALSFLVAGPS